MRFKTRQVYSSGSLGGPRITLANRALFNLRSMGLRPIPHSVMTRRYLITGLPRCRSAWLAAFLTAHGSPCAHEAAISLGRSATLQDVFDAGFEGLCDPGAPLRYRATLEDAMRGCPTVLIRRDARMARASFECWLGQPLPDAGWAMVESSLAWFEETFSPKVFDFHQLDDERMMEELVWHVLRAPLDHRLFRLFDTLKIEQHKNKAHAMIRNLEMEPA